MSTALVMDLKIRTLFDKSCLQLFLFSKPSHPWAFPRCEAQCASCLIARLQCIVLFVEGPMRFRGSRIQCGLTCALLRHTALESKAFGFLLMGVT